MPEKPPSIARLEAFSDGVIAVIITIMVLELKVPHENGPAALFAILPILVIYLIYFAFTGIYWINHQHLIERLESADRVTLYSNLIFLFSLSLLPFFTSYLIEKGLAPFTVSLYALSMIVTGFSFFLLRVSVHQDLKRTGHLRKQDTGERGKHLASLALYVIAIPLSYYQPKLALAVIALVTVVWVIPGLAPRKRHEAR